jgi:MOSC domain-containing protein YiiM
VSEARRIEILGLLASPVHRYEGRPSEGPLDFDGDEERERITIRAGLGIVGDRFFGRPAHREASVTIMAIESLESVATDLALDAVPDAAATRRNVITRGLAIDELRGQEFSLDTGAGPVRFRGHRPANPCAWMDIVLAPGAFRALRGRGGLRCEPLSDGVLDLGAADFRLFGP